MIFDAIREDGKRFLSLCPSNVDSNCYQTILDQALPEMYTSRPLFQQDGPSCHTFRSTAAYRSSKSIRMLSHWPAQRYG